MDRLDIPEQVDRILRSSTFAGKAQLRKLLEFLFQSMDSQATLKPDRVIRELWPEETKTKGTADVATEMNRLRKTLDSYYNEEGINDPIRIILPNRTPAGSNGRKERRWIEAEPHREAVCPVPAAVPPAVDRLRRLKISAIIVALSIVAFYVVAKFAADDRPRSGRLDGGTLTILNAAGKELWRKTFPEGFSPEYYEKGLAPRMWFGDLDGDGHTEVLLLYHPAVSPDSHSTTLVCYSARGNEKWRWVPGKVLPELHGSPATFEIVGFGVLQAGRKEHRRIVVSSSHHPFYPHQIAILDSNGKMQGEYWHSGHLDQLTLADLDGDGQQEIIATGISNGYRQATLVVLNPSRVFGASAETARPELQLHGMGVAEERTRLLFPRSDLSVALSVYNEAQEAIVENGKIRLSVRETRQFPGSLIWYEFDKDLNLLSVKADDMFRSAHAEFYLKGNNAHSFSNQEENEFQKIRCLVGCKSEFVSNQIHGK